MEPPYLFYLGICISTSIHRNPSFGIQELQALAALTLSTSHGLLPFEMRSTWSVQLQVRGEMLPRLGRIHLVVGCSWFLRGRGLGEVSGNEEHCMHHVPIPRNRKLKEGAMP
jgi:hypothetical protein